jgi:peptide deformylase
MIYDLIPDSDPRLHSRVPEFDFDNPPIDPEQLFANLVETMRHNRGAGLAANQCGLPYRCFVAYYEGEPFIAFNPEVKLEEGSQTDTEGCLSFPGTILTVTRAMGVHFVFQTATGFKKIHSVAGFRARVALHEIDHLNGVVFTERADETQD